VDTGEETAAPLADGELAPDETAPAVEGELPPDGSDAA
jgi:hypothetical protein